MLFLMTYFTVNEIIIAAKSIMDRIALQEAWTIVKNPCLYWSEPL